MFLVSDHTGASDEHLLIEDGWLYLAGQLDLNTKRLAGWKLGNSLDSELVIEAFERAVKLWQMFSNRILPGGRRGFFHPDSLRFGEGIFLSKIVATAQAVAEMTFQKLP
jgi:hypothetical protein